MTWLLAFASVPSPVATVIVSHGRGAVAGWEVVEERGEIKTGNKAWLRRRLHAAIMCEYLEGRV